MPTEDWIKKVSKDLHSISESLASISNKFHKLTPELEHAVDARYANEASDPRVQLLSDALSVSRMADKELSQVSWKMRRITEDWRRSRPSNSDEHDALTSSLFSLQQERNELETLSEIARALNSTLEFDAVLQLVMDRVIRFVNAERGFIMLINPETGEPEFARPIANSESATISQSTVKRVIRTGEPVLTDDTETDDDLNKQESILRNSIRSVMCAPLIVRDRCIGVVYVDKQFRTTLFEPRHRELLLAFCNQAAIAIDNARLFADLNKTMKRVREDKQYMDNIFGSIVNGVVTTDSGGIITTFNAAAGYVLSLSPDVVMHKHYVEAFNSLPQVGLVELLNKAHKDHEHGTLVTEPIECSIPTRGTVSLNCYVSALRDTQGKHIGMALVIDDQTSMKEALAKTERVRRMFEQYVHPNVVQELMRNPLALNLGGETKEISVIFADIRGYTSLSENMQPHAVMHLINDYLKIMCDALWDEMGTLTAFQGDALMAIFNAPLSQNDHALRAVRAALKMRAAVLKHQSERWERFPVLFGFGINTGWATVGNVGAQGRLQNYTAIGDVINVASRLQSNATDNEIYITDATYRRVAQYVQVSPPFNLTVKGRTTPLIVGRLLGLA